MSDARCPGQDQRYWRPEDIFWLACPRCGAEIEFWKDEPARVCAGCRTAVRNPRMDQGCSTWCREAGRCLGHPVESAAGAAAGPEFAGRPGAH
jgi:hypothetical protein